MVVADRLLPPGPRPREVWLTFGLAVLLHGLLVAAIVLMPRLQFGHYITVPVSYTVSLVDAPPGGRGGGGPSPAPPPVARVSPPPPPAQPAAPPQPAPAVRPAPRAEEELTLPARRQPRERPREAAPSLRPPALRPRETVREPAQPAVPATPPAPPAPVAPPAPAVASVGNGAGTGIGKERGIELAGPSAGAGGGTTLNYYLTLVDRKIQDNWLPLTPAGSPEVVVVIQFRVLRSGQVRDVQLDTSSGNNAVDLAAMRAIRQSLPLPPFPNLLTEPYLDLRYRFVQERG